MPVTKTTRYTHRSEYKIFRESLIDWKDIPPVVDIVDKWIEGISRGWKWNSAHRILGGTCDCFPHHSNGLVCYTCYPAHRSQRVSIIEPRLVRYPTRFTLRIFKNDLDKRSRDLVKKLTVLWYDPYIAKRRTEVELTRLCIKEKWWKEHVELRSLHKKDYLFYRNMFELDEDAMDQLESCIGRKRTVWKLKKQWEYTWIYFAHSVGMTYRHFSIYGLYRDYETAQMLAREKRDLKVLANDLLRQHRKKRKKEDERVEFLTIEEIERSDHYRRRILDSPFFDYRTED